MSRAFRCVSTGLLMMGLVSLSGCGSSEDISYEYPTDPENEPGRSDILARSTTLFGSDGLSIDLGGSDTGAAASGAGIGVNALLWRATLDTVSFMPLSSADPFGGVVITDWYQPPESPTERFKVNVYILGRALTADGVRAAIFRQVLHPSGTWIDSPVSQGTNIDLENVILTRAREMRVAQRVASE